MLSWVSLTPSKKMIPPVEKVLVPVPPTKVESEELEVSAVADVQTAARPAEPEPVKLEPPTQVPDIEKQPAVMFQPFAAVEVAVELTFKKFVTARLVRVDVAVVDVAVKLRETVSPTTESRA